MGGSKINSERCLYQYRLSHETRKFQTKIRTYHLEGIGKKNKKIPKSADNRSMKPRTGFFLKIKKKLISHYPDSFKKGEEKEQNKQNKK